MASESSSRFPHLRKVCVVGYCRNRENYEYNIHIVDLKLGESNVLALDVDCIFYPAFCLLGCTLYIFEGYNWRDNPNGGKSVLRFDLPDKFSNIKLDKSMLIQDSYMNHVKVYPKAAVTPSGGILVFSSQIDCGTTNYDFELYDPIKRICHLLPRLRPPMDLDFGHLLIKSFTFLDKTVLFLQTQNGVYTLNLKPPHKGKRWKRFGFCAAAGIPSFPGNSLAVIGKDICLIPFYAFDIDKSGIQNEQEVFSRWYFSFPDFKPLLNHFCYSAGITVVDDDSVLDDCAVQGCNVVVFQVGLDNEGKSPQLRFEDTGSMSHELVFDVFNCDLNECRKKLSEIRRQKFKENVDWWKRKSEAFPLPGTVKIKSFKISLKARGCDRFCFCSISSIPDI